MNQNYVFHPPNDVAPRSNDTWHQIVNTAGEGLKRLTLPIPYFAEASCGAMIKNAIDVAFAKWRGVSNGKLSFVKAKRRLSIDDYGISFVMSQSGWVGSEGLLAYTWFPAGPSEETITSNIVTFNGFNFDWHSGDPYWIPASTKPKKLASADVNCTVLHEIGHALGFDHSNNPLSVMYPYLHDKGDTFNPIDLVGVNTTYSGATP